MLDRYNRNIDYVRLSVTDKCNLNCTYCMPRGCSVYQKPVEALTDEEILKLCRAFALVGIKKIKITGGEPLIRKNIVSLIKEIKKIAGIENVTLTTNGILLYKCLGGLKDAGIDSINISLNAVDAPLFQEISGHDKANTVLKVLDEAVYMGFNSIKVNCVMIKQINESQYIKIAQLAKDRPIRSRFIEMMPIGLGKEFQVTASEEVFAILEDRFGKLKVEQKKIGNGPATYFKPEGFVGSIGFISAISHKFCDKCNRVRVSSDGTLKTCLQYDSGANLKDLLKGNDTERLLNKVRDIIFYKEREHYFDILDSPNKPELKYMSQIGG